MLLDQNRIRRFDLFYFSVFFSCKTIPSRGRENQTSNNLIRSMPLKLVASANHESEDQCQPLSANCFSNHPGVPMFQYFSFENEILVLIQTNCEWKSQVKNKSALFLPQRTVKTGLRS